MPTTLFLQDAHPILHLSRDCHYRWRIDDARLTRSVSREGFLPDTSACEGFLESMKIKMFYGVFLQDVALENCMQQI